MFEKKGTVLFILILLLVCVGGFLEYEVNKIIKSMGEISKSISTLSENLTPEIKEVEEDIEGRGINVMLELREGRRR